MKGIKEAHGVMNYFDGRKYEGEWKNDLMHGKGTFVWPDGRKYVGHYEKDVKKG